MTQPKHMQILARLRSREVLAGVPPPEYRTILARLKTLANDDSPLLTMHERDDILGWSLKDSRGKAKTLWSLVQGRKP